MNQLKTLADSFNSLALLVLDILSRLPIHCILQCRCVCKMFLCFISDSEFAPLHLSRSPLSILFKTRLPLIAPEKLQLSHVDADGKKFKIYKFNFTSESSLPTCDISDDMSACNGLICLVGLKPNESFYVCNPILGEYVKIRPPPSDKNKQRGFFWGFGYSSPTKQYKILQTYHDTFDWEAERRAGIQDLFELSKLATADGTAHVYTIGTATWRNIGNAPKDFVSLPFNAFLNGVIHWSNISPRGAEFIHSFDFDAEQFGIVPPPDHFQELDKKFTSHTMTGVLGGCLFIIHFADVTHFDIWVMKEYGVKKSWTKQFVIENLYPSGRGLDIYQPMLVLSNGKILMLYKETAIVCYNQKRKQFRAFFQTGSLLMRLDAIAHTPSFVSLYNVAKGEKISRIRRTRVYDKICKEGFQDCAGFGNNIG